MKEAIIAFTAEVRGEIEPCGCPTLPYGGFERRARLLEQLRQEGVPVFVLDAGDMLVKGFSGRDDRQAERARTVLTLASQTGLDAWTPSPTDLVPGGLGLLSPTPALSANWQKPEGGLVLPAARVIERDGFRLGVVGLSTEVKDYPSKNPVEAVKAAISAAGAADTWVVLSNAPASDNRAVAEGVPGLGAVLAVPGDSHDAPESTSGAPLIEAPDRGRYVTVVRLADATDGGPWTIAERGPWKELASLRRRLPLLGQDANLRSQIDAARKEVETASAGSSRVLIEDRPLGSDLDGQTTLTDTIHAFKKDTEAAATRTVEAEGGPSYATSADCVRCHADRFAAWVYSPHAKAYDALVARGEEKNTECIGCHTTGFGKPGGFGELTDANLRRFKSVQCEACHGPLDSHPESDQKSAVITEQTCTTCHDPANSPQFDYVKWLPKVSCAMVSASKQDAPQ